MRPSVIAEEAIKDVEAFRIDLKTYEQMLPSYSNVLGTPADPTVGVRAAISGRLALIEDIANEVGLVEPERLRQWNSYMMTGRAITASDELLGMLHGAERRAEVMGAAGPKLAAERMHRWVWQPAAELWGNGHRREAVQAAATSILDQQLPAKLGLPRSTNPRNLISQAFATTPPRPRFGSDCRGTPKGRQTGPNAHEGAMYLGFACVSAIRNLATHTTDQPDADSALESLAALSLLARWIDDAEIVTA